MQPEAGTSRPQASAAWRGEAKCRWPDAMDMAWLIGRGRWATVAWCAGLSVQLHGTEQLARVALKAINGYGCGHGCWRDHELVDLAVPELFDLAVEQARGARRGAHFASCRSCRWVFSGKADAAAAARAQRRQDGRP